MIWGSLDTFLIEDEFWQDRMGKPLANKEFLEALLTYGSYERYLFFCRDTQERRRLEEVLQRALSAASLQKVRIHLQALFTEKTRENPPHVMHLGDFTYYMPSLLNYRNSLRDQRIFPITGVTHSLDGPWMQMRLLEILLSAPGPCDAIVCTSMCAMEMLKKAFAGISEWFLSRWGCSLPDPPRLVHIPLGISEEHFVPQDPVECRRRLGVPEGSVVVLSLARFSPRNKMDLSPFLECIRWLRMRPHIPSFLVILAGAGEDHQVNLVKELIETLELGGCVRVLPNVPPHQKGTIYGASDIFVSMVDNYQETFGLTVLEAMAHGLPVIASHFNGYKELVEDGENGFLIPTYSSPSNDPWESISGILDPSMWRFYFAQKVSFDFNRLAQSMEILITSPQLRRKMGIRALRGMTGRHWSAVVRRYEELWQDLWRESLSWRGCKKGRDETHLSFWARFVGRSFSHFPTKNLSQYDLVSLSRYGKEMLEENFKPILYEDMAALLSEPVLKSLMDLGGSGPVEIDELIRQASERHGVSREMAVLHIDWLIKHGFLCLDSKDALWSPHKTTVPENESRHDLHLS
jgi:glycosyltransferase involved in cell wall biosynthesis